MWTRDGDGEKTSIAVQNEHGSGLDAHENVHSHHHRMNVPLVHKAASSVQLSLPPNVHKEPSSSSSSCSLRKFSQFRRQCITPSTDKATPRADPKSACWKNRVQVGMVRLRVQFQIVDRGCQRNNLSNQQPHERVSAFDRESETKRSAPTFVVEDLCRRRCRRSGFILAFREGPTVRCQSSVFESRRVAPHAHADGGASSHHDSVLVFTWSIFLGLGSTMPKRFTMTVRDIRHHGRDAAGHLHDP